MDGTTQRSVQFNPVVVFPIVILLWLAYAIWQTLLTLGQLSEPHYALLSLLPGVLGAGLLLASGFSREECFLCIAPLSRASFLVLVGILIFSWGVILPFGTWQGWDWLVALVYAPASGFAQELFFRAVLFPLFLRLFAGRLLPALLSHSLLFGLWHIGPLFLGAPLWAVLAVMGVPFLCGLGWGWAVQRDRTVLWVMVQHSLILVVSSQLIFTA